jgi:hypothetical protein
MWGFRELINQRVQVGKSSGFKTEKNGWAEFKNYTPKLKSTPATQFVTQNR